MKNIINNIAEKIAEQKGFLLINSVTKGSNRKPIFEIYIDNKIGISAENCAEFSRAVKDELEKTDYADLDYKLVVSSPGIDEPIKFLDQYYKHVNRDFKISFEENGTVLSIEAKLIKIDGDSLLFLYKDEERLVNFNNIKKAKVKIRF